MKESHATNIHMNEDKDKNIDKNTDENSDMINVKTANKIGLLTYHHTTNFGSLLQTYALAKKVEKLGYRCEVIDYYNDAVEERERPRKLSDCKGLRALRDYFKYEPSKRKKAEAFAEFTGKELHISKKRCNKNNLDELKGAYGTFIVGSDLTWDFSINGHDTTYMLGFVPDGIKKIAYASSVGAIWEGEERKEVQSLLSRFDHIGVREYEIQTLLTDEFGLEADFVCDPTMLLDSDTWRSMAAPRMIDEKYVIVYMTAPEQKNYKDAVRFANEHGYGVYVISYSWVPDDMKPICPAEVGEFLSLILYAEAVFTASYHGMLFSLYFQKEFYYYNRGWKARMRSIASYLDIEHRENLTVDNKPLNYETIDSRISEFRDYSVSRLKTYLED